MSVKNERKESKAKEREEKEEESSALRGCAKSRVRQRKSTREGNRLRGPPVVGRRTLQIPVNRIQLRCYREYRWRLFPSVHPIHNAQPYGDSRAQTKGSLSLSVYSSYVLTTKPCDCFRMFQNTVPETRFSPTILSDSLTSYLDLFLNVHLKWNR